MRHLSADTWPVVKVWGLLRRESKIKFTSIAVEREPAYRINSGVHDPSGTELAFTRSRGAARTALH